MTEVKEEDKTIKETEESEGLPFFDIPEVIPGQVLPFVTTSKDACLECLKLFSPKSTETVLDLGCGDGRLLFYAISKYKCKGIGIDINKELIDECNQKKITDNINEIKFFVDDFTREDFDFYESECIFMYGLPKVLKKMKNKIIKYLNENHNRRFISIRFPIFGLIPTKIDETFKIYYYDYLSKEGKFGNPEDLNFNPIF